MLEYVLAGGVAVVRAAIAWGRRLLQRQSRQPVNAPVSLHARATSKAEVGAVEADPRREVETLLRQARKAMAVGDRARAHRLASMACERDPTSAEAWLWCGASADGVEEQRRLLQRVLEIQPEHPIAISLLRELGSAVPETPTAPASDEKVPSAAIGVPGLVSAGIAALDRRDEDLAYRCFSVVTDIDPSHARAWFLRAKTAKDLDEVITCLERAVEIEPENAQVQRQLNWALKRKERELAAAKFEQPAPAGSSRGQLVAPPRPIARRPVTPVITGALGVLGRSVGSTASLVVAAVWTWIGLLTILRSGDASTEPLPLIVLEGADRFMQAGPGRWLPQVRLPSLAVPDGIEALSGFDLGFAIPAALAFGFLLLSMAIRHGEPGARFWATAFAGVQVLIALNFGQTVETAQVVLLASILLTVGALFAPAGIGERAISSGSY